MSATADSEHGPEATIAACFADLEANAPPESVLARLRPVSGRIEERSPLRARLLQAQAIAKLRLGYSEDALGDLHEARRLLETQADRHQLADVFRAIAMVHGWRGDGREAALALLRTVAEATAANHFQAVAAALVEGGRLQIEIGRPRDAAALLACTLDAGGSSLPARERDRAGVNLVQALVAAGRIEEARARLDDIMPALQDPEGRPRVLAEIERARIAQAADDRAGAREALDRAASLVSDPQSFSHVDLAHAEAEIALAQRDPVRAESLLRDVVSRYATDQLVGREVVARLLQARTFDALGQFEEAERTLAAALRRALARGLSGHADEVRSRIAARGGVEGACLAGELPGSGRTDAAQRFVRRRALGEGGFGSVSRGYDLELGIEVALKRSPLKDIYDPVARDRLLTAARTEVAAAARIEHPGVARIHGLLIDTDGDALLIEELVEGPTLRAEMENPAKPIERARALDLLARLGFALAAVHAAGVVHRDLKPDNVILRGGVSPVIVDFGIALVGKHDPARGSGTRSYMAPEQAAGRAVDFRADLYSIGIIAHELLAGAPPDPSRPVRFAPLAHRRHARAMRRRLAAAGVEPPIADLVTSLLAPTPRQRPSSAAFVGTRFAEAAGEAFLDAAKPAKPMR
jgi:tRNA A-37 threonylcarbamoyl transferase component Bud32/tetratricopeptide (TPR) repeat protein